MENLLRTKETADCQKRITESWNTLTNIKEMPSKEQFKDFEKGIEALRVIYEVSEVTKTPNYSEIHHIVDEFMTAVEIAQENVSENVQLEDMEYKNVKWDELCAKLEPEIGLLYHSIPKILTVSPALMFYCIVVLCIAVAVGIYIKNK